MNKRNIVIKIDTGIFLKVGFTTQNRNIQNDKICTGRDLRKFAEVLIIDEIEELSIKV